MSVPGRRDGGWTRASSRDGPANRARAPSRDRPADQARVRLTRLRLVVVLALALGLAQILFEDVVLFLATTQDGVSGALSSPVVAIGVPLTIAALLLVLLVGGALWTDSRQGRGRSEGTTDPDDQDDHQ